MWANPGEIPNNQIDDDHNGYIDDVHGWNFIGGKDGRNVEYDNLEMTRLLRKLKPIYENFNSIDIKDKNQQLEYELYQKVKSDYEINYEKYAVNYSQLKEMVTRFSELNTQCKTQLKKDTIGLIELQAFVSSNTSEMKVRAEGIRFLKSGSFENLEILITGLKEAFDFYKTFIEYSLNLDFDPRSIVGDDYSNSNERYYGNPDCKGPDSFHGTHVSGIIAGKRNNGIGIDGIANNVKIMALRCVPNGDERDKDIANAIFYAVENGAKILNMSFGKKYSWDKKIVDDAIKYAESKDVLIIHAAGNDHANTDSVTYFPCKKFEDKGEANNFLNIAAISWKNNQNLTADFSNYGKKTVDFFAPGVDIYSTAPENKYKDASGTSMAAPVVTGVAAVIKSYYPDISAKNLKKILIKSSLKSASKNKVYKPGSEELVKFGSLSSSGGIVNLYEALKLAAKYSKIKP